MLSYSFPDQKLMAELTAKMLLETGAVYFRPEEPFTYTSGLVSPVYTDCRKLISFPRVRNTLMDFAASTIQREVGFEQFDAVAGGETAGIPYAAWIADRLALPMQYIRKKPKGFGRNAQIEGEIHEGQRVLLVEDLTTDGGSKLKFCEAIRNAGAEVAHGLVIFFYDIFPDTRATLAKSGFELHYLATLQDVLGALAGQGQIDSDAQKEVQAFIDDPLTWSGKHGGITELAQSE